MQLNLAQAILNDTPENEKEWEITITLTFQ